ncbi:hypothetical protein, partial [Gottfriedia acidiceleris]|uniref:hypothetical protein n=1 Tax=Gottfriedia acidiceleris TaxID=371036 RepID=UPI00197A96A5
NFVRNSNNIRIEHIRHQPGGRDISSYNLYMFVSTIDKAFSKLLRQLHRNIKIKDTLYVKTLSINITNFHLLLGSLK